MAAAADSRDPRDRETMSLPCRCGCTLGLQTKHKQHWTWRPKVGRNHAHARRGATSCPPGLNPKEQRLSSTQSTQSGVGAADRGLRNARSQSCATRVSETDSFPFPFPLPTSPFPDPMQRRCMTRQEARLGLDHLSAMGACTCELIAKSLWNMLSSKSLRFADSTQLSQQLRSKRSLAPSMNRASS